MRTVSTSPRTLNPWASFVHELLATPMDLSVLFVLSFVGDFTAFGVPFFLPVWIFLMTFRRIGLVSTVELKAQGLLLIGLFPLLAQPYKFTPEYYWAGWYCILYVNAIWHFRKILDRLTLGEASARIYIILPVIVLLGLSALTAVFGAGARQSFVFGPNNYYRIVGVIYFVTLVLFRRHLESSPHRKSRQLTSLFVLFLSLFAGLFVMYRTGSRGATIVGITMLIGFLNTLRHIPSRGLRRTTFSGLGFLLFSGVVFLASPAAEKFIKDSRVFTFYDRGASSGSIGARVSFLQNATEFFVEDNYLLGEGSDYKFSYPHNFYLDLLYNAGILPFFYLLAMTAASIWMLIQRRVSRSWIETAIIFSPIFLGSMVSGTLYDNYPIITFLTIFPIAAAAHNKGLTKRL